METTTTPSLRTFEVTIPEQYTDTLKQFIKALKGKIKAEKKTGLDEALEEFRMVAADVIQAAIEEGKPLYLRGEQLLY